MSERVQEARKLVEIDRGVRSLETRAGGRAQAGVRDAASQIAFNVKRLRLRRGYYTVAALAHASGVGAELLERIESQQSQPTIKTLWSLATALGVPSTNLEGTVAWYNAGVEQGIDPDYLKDAKFLEPVATAPFYGAELRPATVASTACGLRIDPFATARSTDGHGIPGRFAAGECTGGVVGQQYVGSGNNYANCLVFGRVAGASAAALVVGS